MESISDSRKRICIHTTGTNSADKQLSSIEGGSIEGRNDQSLKQVEQQKGLGIDTAQDDRAVLISPTLNNGPVHRTVGTATLDNHYGRNQIAINSLVSNQNPLTSAPTIQIQNQQHLNGPNGLLSSMLLSPNTSGPHVSMNPLFVHDRTSELAQRHNIQNFELVRNGLNPNVLAPSLLGSANRQMNAAIHQNVVNNSIALGSANGLFRATATNGMFHPLQHPEGLLTSTIDLATLPDHLKPLALALRSKESNPVQQALNILQVNPALSSQTRLISSQSQNPWLAAVSLLQANASPSPSRANPSVIPGSVVPTGTMNGLMNNNLERNNSVAPSDATAPFSLGSLPQGSPISSETQSAYDSSASSLRSIPEDSDKNESRKKRKKCLQDSDSDSNEDLSPDSSTIFHGNVLVALPEDENILTESRCIIRRQIEFFSATKDDVKAIKNGRSKLPEVGQVGIRCIHCKHLSHQDRPMRAAVFPSSLSQIYMAVKNWQHFHFSLCNEIPEECRERIAALNTKRKRVGGSGSIYWANAAKQLGVVEYKHGLCFGRDPGKL